MLTFLLRRVLEGAATLLIVILLTFWLVRLAPGDPVSYMAGLTASAEYIAEMREKLGLNLPIWDQLVIYLRDIAEADLGYSLIWQRPVTDVILSRLPASLLLMGTSFAVFLPLGIVLGAIGSRYPQGRLDNAINVASLAAFSLPQFWVGMILLLVFGLWLGLLPIQGMWTVGAQLTGTDAVLDTLAHLILPATALGLAELALFVRITRASMLEIADQDFVRTAVSKGIGERAVLLRHVLRNALLPIVTVAAIRLRYLFAGAIVVEAIFSWPGIGSLTINAMFQRDYPMVLGITIWATVVVLVTNLAVDLVYTRIDPRIENW